jgi:hypothetical protein
MFPLSLNILKGERKDSMPVTGRGDRVVIETSWLLHFLDYR